MKKVILSIICVLLVLSLAISSFAISSVSVKNVTLNRSTLSMYTGQYYDLVPSFTPANTTQRLVSYSTSNKNVATVSALGKIVAVGQGKATITVTSTNNQKAVAKCTVTVNQSGMMMSQNPKNKITVSCGMIFPELVEGGAIDYLENRFGIDFKWRPLTLADWQSQINTWVAAGDQPDLTWWHVNASLTNQYIQWSKQGAFRPITDQMIKVRPNLQDLADQSISLPYFKVDGKLYYWPVFLKYPKESNSTSPNTWIYRRDWARAVGLYKTGDVYNWEEWLNLVRAVVKKDPGKNGAGKTIGMATFTWGWPTNLLLSFGSVPAMDGVGYYKDEKTGKYVWSPSTAEFKKELKITQDIYKEGLVSKDNVSWKGSEAQDKFISGLEFSVYGAVYGSIASYTENMFKAGTIKSNKSDNVGLAIVKYDGNLWLHEMEDYWTGICFSSKISDLAMNRVLNMYDYLAGNEGGILYTGNGVEGKDYTLDKNGNIVSKWPKDPKDPSGQLRIVPAEYKDRFNFPLMPGSQHTDLQMTLLASTDSAKYDAREVFKIWNYPHKTKKIDWQMNFYSAKNKDLFGNFSAETITKMAELIPTSTNISADWDAYVKSKMPQVNLVLKEINDKFGKK